MSEWIVEKDSGCGCCFVLIAVFETEKEAEQFIDGRYGYWISEIEDDDNE